MITTEDEAIKVQGQFKIWQEWGKMRVLGKRVYFESKVLKSLKREKSSEKVAQDCLSFEERKNEGSFMDTIRLRERILKRAN